MAKNKKMNLIFLGIDTIRADHMSMYGYHRLTTPHMDKCAEGGAVFENAFSPHIPTTPGYTSMFTGMDCFGTNVVALRHEGGLDQRLTTLAELLGKQKFNTTCVGFSGNAASRGFQKYIDFSGWGSWAEGRSHKAENLNEVTIPELKRLAGERKPFFLFLRHMDPHSPYLPPKPFDRMFYDGNEFDKKNHSLDTAMKFKPFCDFFASWFPPHCKDKEYIIAQYDGALAYMDSCIADIFATVKSLGLEEDTLIVINSDHGESLHDHDCFFDHHSMYEPTLHVPLAFVCPGRVPSGQRFRDICQSKDLMPTILDIMELSNGIKFDGRSLMPLMAGQPREIEPEFYITEATWMRKHGWRTPHWKLIHALEPDFHFKPEVELYDLVADPGELNNVAKKEPGVVKMLEARMQAHIKRREKETGRKNPMFTNLNWNGFGRPFKTSKEAYNTLHIGSPNAAQALQAAELQAQRGQKKL